MAKPQRNTQAHTSDLDVTLQPQTSTQVLKRGSNSQTPFGASNRLWRTHERRERREGPLCRTFLKSGLMPYCLELPKAQHTRDFTYLA